MAEWQVLDSFPAYAAAGSDYFTRADVGEIEQTFAGETNVRRERVLVTPAEIDYEGVVCLGERTVRHMARLFGMVDGWHAANLITDNERLYNERDQLSTELAAAKSEIAYLRSQMEHRLDEVYVAADGTKHASLAAAIEQSERVLTGLRPKPQRGVAPLSEADAPAPKIPAKKGTRR